MPKSIARERTFKEIHSSILEVISEENSEDIVEELSNELTRKFLTAGEYRSVRGIPKVISCPLKNCRK